MAERSGIEMDGPLGPMMRLLGVVSASRLCVNPDAVRVGNLLYRAYVQGDMLIRAY